ncbi:hypothetical protein OIO90_005042 [Microbotryomycetes sp. JL221]|nr:hypothetical protein OIO90_005042 [Microbotryomycetes sp. JL221]
MRFALTTALRTAFVASRAATRTYGTAFVTQRPLLLASADQATTRRLLTTSPTRRDQDAAADAETTRLQSSAGSGKGGKRDKAAAALKRKERERAKRQRDKERVQLQKQREKERKQKQKQREQEQKVKAKAKAKAAAKPRSVLRPPKAPVNAWGIFLRDFVQSRKESLAPGEKLASVSAMTKEAAPLYRELAPSERHELAQRAEEDRRAYPQILKEWQATLTPEMIKQENAVRLKRRKLGLSKRRPIKLEGEPKKPLSGYMRFNNEVRSGSSAHGDVLRGETSVLEQSKLIAAAWRSLSESEREEYHEQYRSDKERYAEEKKRFDEEVASRSA